jgi:drug/metabolite transporter (DMT)-like permease
MSGRALALVLCAAAIHAAWNALAKRAQHPIVFLWSSVAIATLVLAPLGLRYLPADGLPAAAVPFVMATIVIHALYFYALARGYASGGDLSLVYPVARGLGVALVPLLAFLLLDERPSALGAAGVLLVIVGIAAISLASTSLSPRGGEGRVRGSVLARGTGWAVLTGLTIAAYSLVDKVGVSRLHPLPYLGLLGVGMSLILAPVVWRARAAFLHEWRVNWKAILLASTLNLTSYLLVLFAFRLAKAGYVVAARESSIVLSVLIGWMWLGEGGLARRLLGAAVVLAGVACVALARYPARPVSRRARSRARDRLPREPLEVVDHPLRPRRGQLRAGIRCGHADGAHAGGAGGVNAHEGVLEHDAAGGVGAQTPGGEHVDLRVGLAPPHVVRGHHHREVLEQADGVQQLIDVVRGRGGAHRQG